MEPSLTRYVLRQSWPRQIVLVVLALVSFPFLYLFYELPKTIVNRAIAPDAGQFPMDLLGLEFGQRGYLFALCAGLLALVFVNQGFKYAINVYKGITAERILRQLRADLYARMLKFPLPTFRRMSQGKIIPMITGEVEALGGFIGDLFALPAFQGGTLLVVLGFLFVQNPVMAAAAVSLYPIQIIVIPRLQSHINRLAKQRVQLVRVLSDRIGEAVQGVEEIRVHGTGDAERADFRTRLDAIYDVRYAIYLRKYIVKAINNFVQHLGPFFFYSIGGYLVIMGRLDIGTLLAAVAAHKDLAAPWRELLAYYQSLADSRIRYQQVVAQFSPEGMDEETAASLTESGAGVSVANLTLHDDWGRAIVDDVSLNLPDQGRIAFLGGAGSGADETAMTLAGLLAPERGRVTLPCLPEAGPKVGYVGPSGHVFSGTIRRNLYYGLETAPENQDDALTKRGLEALAVVGFEDDVYRFGLRGRIDPKCDSGLAEALLEARKRFRARLGQSDETGLVEFFDMDRYNANATLAENLLFGVATDNSFAVETLADQPYVRRVLDEAGLTEPLLDTGYIIAKTMVEMFAGLPPGHPFFEQFSFIASSDLPAFQALVARTQRHAVGALDSEDRARLLSLPFKLIPARHRLGALHDDTKRRILIARRMFAAGLPPDLKPKIEFFDPDRYTASASLADNILFGKAVQGQVGAAREVDRMIGDIVAELGLGPAIAAAGLDYDVGVGGARLSAMQRQKLVLARAILKDSEILVLVDATAGLDADSEGRVLDYLLDRYGRSGTLIWSAHHPVLALRFDHVVTFADGHVVGAGPPESLAALRGRLLETEPENHLVGGAGR